MLVVPIVRDQMHVYHPSRISLKVFKPEEYLQWKNKNLLNLPLGNSFAFKNFEDDTFQINIDVLPFKLEEISVKIIEKNTVCIEGRNEERQVDGGYISRHFIRKCNIPEGYDVKQIKATVSAGGILTVTAPKTVESKATKTTIGKEISISRIDTPKTVAHLKHKL